MAVAICLLVLLVLIVASRPGGARRPPGYPVRVREPRFASEEQKRFIYLKHGGCCAHCGRMCYRTSEPVAHQAQFDHIIPYSRGGRTTLANLQLLCRRCNRIKSNRFVG